MPGDARDAHPLTRAWTLTRLAGASLLVGAAAAGFAIAFRLALEYGMLALYGTSRLVEAFAALPLVARLLLPAAGGAAAGLLGLLARRRAGGHGVAEIMESVALGRGRISPVTAVWKALGSLAAVLGGGSIGREGPIVQLGAGAGDVIGRWLGLDARHLRALVAAGTAGGFAGAYNTPIASILFVVEVVTGVISLDLLLPVVATTIVSTTITRLVVGAGPLYGARVFTFSSSWEYLVFLGIGVLAGLAGPLFMAALSRGEKLFRAIPAPGFVRAALGGLVVGALAIGLPQVTGNGYEAIRAILDGSMVPGLVLLLLLAKPIATIGSVSSGSPGGVFTPTMFIGAALGAGVGHVLARAGVGGTVTPGGYALVGMAALAAATVHAPIMATVMVFELSGDYAIVLPLLLATAVATSLARRLRPDSIYTEELRRRGIPWEGTLAQRLAASARARDLMEPEVDAVPATAPLADALARLAAGRGRLVYVTDSGPVRAISLSAAKTIWAGCMRGERTHEGMSAGQLAAPILAARPEDSLLVLGEKLWSVDWGELPVVAADDPSRPIGIVTRRALLGAFDRELLQRDVLMTRVVWFDGQREAVDFLELPDGHRVEIVSPPASIVGEPADGAVLRQRFGVTLVALRRDEGGEAHPGWLDPDAGQRLRASDRLMIIATEAEIERLRASP